MKYLRKGLIVGFLFLLPVQYAFSLEVSRIFNHNMVLQRDTEIPVWGNTVPDGNVTVKLGNSERAVVADQNGSWKVVLPAMTTGGPFQMSIKSGGDSLIIHNILIGDVWVCSGQSNMQLQMKYTENADDEMAKAQYPKIRLFFADQRVLTEPAKDPAGKWYACSPTFVQNFSAVGYYFGKTLFEQLNVPIGLINVSRGGTPITAWMSDAALKSDPDFSEICKAYEDALKIFPDEKKIYDAELDKFNKQYPTADDYTKAYALAKKNGETPPARPSLPYLSPGGLWQSAGCYNAYIYPLSGLKIKGVIWYQGENDVSIAHLYCKLLPALIKDWRELWGQDDLPFGVVQLPGYGKTFSDCRENQWAELREAQFLTSQSVPNVGLIVTIDIGDSEDLHPKNKKDVGRRLAFWALAKVYNSPVSFQGPVYQTFNIEGSKIRIHFQGNDQKLVSKAADGKTLTAFQIAGDDRKFAWACAELDGETVVVWSPEVKSPAAVRYGWEQVPKINLYNQYNLPAGPFRTDEWPGMTFNERVNPRYKTRFK